MDILFIVPYVPDLVRVRPYNLIRNLELHGHCVSVVTLWSSESERQALDELRSHCHQIYAEKTSRLQSLLRCAATLPTSRPLQSAYSWQPKLARRLSSLLNDNNYDIVHIEHLRGSRYAVASKSIIKSSHKKLPVVWDSVDCISLLFSQASKKSWNILNRIVTRFETKRTYEYERWLMGQFDRVLVTSPLDKEAFESMRTSSTGMQSEICVVPNGVDLDYFRPNQAEMRAPNTMVLSGKMSYHANITMAFHLVNDILPIIWSQNPNVKLWIVGKDPPQSVRQLAHNPAVQVTGTVDDIRPYLQNATVAVAPITYGAGIQNKVLEAMACGTPVIATSQAVSALAIQRDRDVKVADEPEQFAQSVLDLLNDPIRQRELGQAGRRYVENNHQWIDITTKLEQIYNQVSHKQ